MCKKVYSILILISPLFVISQKQTEEYITQWKDVAIEQMHLHKIPASITLAQGILESGSGSSRLAKKGNNHFGIKCSNWDGDKIYHDDDIKGECFRKYETAEQSFEDHSLFLQKTRYKELFTLSLTDYKGWAKGLKKAGYATNPKYPELLIELIEKHKLHEYDLVEDPKKKDDGKGNNSSPKNKHQKKDTSNSKIKYYGTIGETTVFIGDKHEIQTSENDIKYITIRKGDSFEKLAKELDMRTWQFYKYNDVPKGYAPKEGERIYIKPKRNKGNEEYHIVKQGETLHEISQFYGVKLKKLRSNNYILPGGEPLAGDKIYLKGKKPSN